MLTAEKDYSSKLYFILVLPPMNSELPFITGVDSLMGAVWEYLKGWFIEVGCGSKLVQSGPSGSLICLIDFMTGKVNPRTTGHLTRFNEKVKKFKALHLSQQKYPFARLPVHLLAMPLRFLAGSTLYSLLKLLTAYSSILEDVKK